MREIKFRAFACGKLFYPEIFSFDSKGISFQTELGYLSSDKFEQFTGLQDKNGIDIYEGDIVRCLMDDWPSKSGDDKQSISDYMVSISCKYIIEYNNAGFIMSFENYGYPHYMTGYHRHGFIEVIGNIHEETK